MPRTCSIRQEVEAWGQHQVSLPWLLERAANRHGDAPRRWYGRSVKRQVEVEYHDGHIALAPIRLIAVYSTQLAPPHEQTHGKAQSREAEVLATHVAQVQGRQFACQSDAEAAIAEPHELICQALELDALIYESPTTQENNPTMGNGP